MKRPLEHEYTSLVSYTRALEVYCDSLAQPKQTVAFLHEVVASDGEPDQALSFSPDNFPLQGVGGFKSVSVKSLVLASDISQDRVDETAKQRHEQESAAWASNSSAQDYAATQPPPEQEPMAWRNAALRVGEDLCSVGPFGYYDMTAKQWIDWALSVVTVHAPPPQRTWVGLTDEDFLDACQLAENGNYLVAFQRIQAKLKQKNGYAEEKNK